MALSLYDTTVPFFISGLTSLSHILKKAEALTKEKGIDEKEFLASRLTPDMLPLTFQIQTASNTSKNTLVRLISSEAVPMEDKETTFAELQDRIAKTLAILKGADKSSFKDDFTTEIEVPMGKDRKMNFTKLAYVQSFAVPNFYFHVVTAYAILRMKGVEIGKGDFLKPEGL